MKKQLIDTTRAYRAKNAARVAHIVRDTVLIGEWEEVQGVEIGRAHV